MAWNKQQNVYVTQRRLQILQKAQDLWPDKSASQLLFEALEELVERKQTELRETDDG